jgi:rhodanese-related sulfurtransferase
MLGVGGGMKQIRAVELKKMMDRKADYVLIDARGHDSYDKEHITGAISIPSDHLGEHLMKDFDKGTTFVTYCTDLECEASTVAAKKLERYGYTKVLEYKEGIQDWKVHHYPTVKKGH